MQTEIFLDHRMLFQTKRGKKLIFKTAKDLRKQSVNKLPRHYLWMGKKSKIVKSFGKREKDFMYLLGIFLGDGFLSPYL